MRNFTKHSSATLSLNESELLDLITKQEERTESTIIRRAIEKIDLDNLYFFIDYSKKIDKENLREHIVHFALTKELSDKLKALADTFNTNKSKIIGAALKLYYSKSNL